MRNVGMISALIKSIIHSVGECTADSALLDDKNNCRHHHPTDIQVLIEHTANRLVSRITDEA